LRTSRLYGSEKDECQRAAVEIAKQGSSGGEVVERRAEAWREFGVQYRFPSGKGRFTVIVTSSE